MHYILLQKMQSFLHYIALHEFPGIGLKDGVYMSRYDEGVLGFLISWFLGFLVVSFMVSWCFAFLASKFQGFT